MNERNSGSESPTLQLGLFPAIKRIPVNGRVFLASVVSGLLAHLYCMVNLVGNEDTITPYTAESTHIASTLQSADTGRWLAGASNWLQGWYRTPMVSGVLIILILALLAQILIRLLPIRSKAGMVLAAVFLEVSSPAQAYVSLHEIGYPLSALLAVLGVWFLRRDYAFHGEGSVETPDEIRRQDGADFTCGERESGGKKGLFRYRLLHSWLPAFLCESISLVILPVNVSCAATILLMLLMSDALSQGSVNWKKQWHWTAECLILLACSGAFLLLSSKAIMAAAGMSTTSYQGAEQAMSGGFLSALPTNYLHAFVKLFIIGIWKIQTLPALRFAYYLCYLLDVVCAAVLLHRCGDSHRGKAARILHLGLYMLLLPAAICTISLVSYGFMYRGQHRMALILFLCGTVLLVEKVVLSGAKENAAKFHNVDKVMLYVMTAAFALMIYAGFLFDNIGYVNQHHVMLHDQTLCTRILTKLDSTEGFSYDQPVYFLNILSTDGEEAVSPMRLDPELDSVIWPVSTTNLYAYGDSSFRYHMENYEGVVFGRPSEEEAGKIEASGLREQYLSLRPYEFHVEKMDGVWVVVVKTVMPPSVAYG